MARWTYAIVGVVLLAGIFVAVSIFDFSPSTIDALTKTGTAIMIGMAIEAIRQAKKKPPKDDSASK